MKRTLRPPRPMKWIVQATRTVESGGWTTTFQIPSFELSEVLGICTEEHAKNVAREILGPYGKLSITVGRIE